MQTVTCRSQLILEILNQWLNFPPSGFSFERPEGHDQLQLVLSDSYCRRLARVFGYIAEIKLSPSGAGTPTPTQLQVATLLPWRYGSTPAERVDSFIFVRLQAFVSKAAFASAPAALLRVGMPVVGFVEPSSVIV